MDKIQQYVYLKEGRLFEENACNFSTCEVFNIVYKYVREKCEKCEKCDLKEVCRFKKLLR